MTGNGALKRDDYDILHELDRRHNEQAARVRKMLLDAGRSDLVEALENNLRDVRLGKTQARATWHALSKSQRKTLQVMSDSWYIVRGKACKTIYDAHATSRVTRRLCRLPTLRVLLQRGLCEADGAERDPERRVIISERGRFVLKHGTIME